MVKRLRIIVMALFLALTLAATSFAGAHATGHTKADEKGPGILLVTFGTSIPEAQVSFTNIEKKVKTAFPGVPVRWAYTSYIIRHKLAKQGRNIDSVEIALAKMMDEGYTQVAVQSLHMIPGAEFHDIQVNARLFGQMSGGFDNIAIGYPMLSTAADLDRAVESFIRVIPAERKKDEAVVLMGHGTHHPSDAFYSAMMYKFQKADPNIYVGTVEGHPTLDDVKEMLIKKGVKKAYLIPFMSVAGDHARNDMAGAEEDSWQSILTKAGIECVPVLKGLAEYDILADIWVDHLKTAMKHLK
ncbi:sirohydrochlorin cobaltochelatase [Desulfonema ishimotonii]|uniref:Sirohydrochlorin cobaltochelatase n=1 Tax=Desulfonema ishimotonii TaxID=45657 RepID=A0A401FTV3_9BACT|nr:sirohydrochlorin cobaltochelatase [Desulfonema ishimotonii]GBC60399.1 sirohydrochlorin cobaltochelatase [Desulfonema ishimotonii]